MASLESFLDQSRSEYSGMRLGLHRIRELSRKLGHPERRYATVLVAGTNGKGSVARMIESVLRKAGYCTGLYTSPHLEHFTERIQIAGKEVSKSELEKILADWEAQGLMESSGRIPTGEGEHLTWFEKATLLAFEAFRRAGVQIAVLEVGLGGRMDATNVAEPLVSAITTIGLDHTEVLGTTLEEIAREKAGILRMDRPLILGAMPEKVRSWLKDHALAEGAFPILTEAVSGRPEKFTYQEFADLRLPLRGDHQLANAAVAIEALWALAVRGYSWPDTALKQGLEAVQNPGRLEWMGGTPPVLLDGAHNPQALAALIRYLDEFHSGQRIAVVLGMSKEKDVAAALRLLAPLPADFYFTAFPNVRSLDTESWRRAAREASLTGEFFEDPRQALSAARSRQPAADLVLVTGSLFLVAALRPFL